ncbi:BQ2448_2780 [Microbotryum intermedium]|uniref:BQ2448_2780 protein n=1 Tax=Microbotryum intermedium TaxID=269621 RepID=A0A238FBG5_9BASI|nr:BQ2448_2780 [Microbotryum intermedium]
MPHKRAKRAIRDQNTVAAGYDNPPNVGDSIPHPNHVKNSIPRVATPGQGMGVLAPSASTSSSMNKNKKRKMLIENKRDSFGGRKDMKGMSKNAYRVLNAVALREEYNTNKKRRRQEEQDKLNPNQKKEKLTAMPYESLRDFSHRVEMSMRSSIDMAIRGAKSTAQKKKDRSKTKGKGRAIDDEEDEIQEMEEENQKRNQEAKGEDGETATGAPTANPSKKAKKDSQEVFDPFAKRQAPARATEFKVASQIRRVGDVVDAPPTLKKGKRGQTNVTRMNEPLPASRMPVSGALKALMEAEREKAIQGYRELKERREKEQS